MAINQSERAYRAWPILTKIAQSHDLITYGSLAEKLGIHHRTIRFVLGIIQDYCLSEHLPPLTIIVVGQGSNTPGDGFIAWDVEDLGHGRTAVYDFNWQSLINPFSFAQGGTEEDALVEDLIRSPRNSGIVYARVRVRGIAQRIFRAALLRVYKERCCFCGLSFTEALEAAHIISWQDSDFEQRMSVTNGLLLCSTHHRLFDAGYLTLSPSFKISFSDPEGVDGVYSPVDLTVANSLHGRMALLPQNRTHYPNPRALASHHARHGLTPIF
jgi:putative restriction endonuclease